MYYFPLYCTYQKAFISYENESVRIQMYIFMQYRKNQTDNVYESRAVVSLKSLGYPCLVISLTGFINNWYQPWKKQNSQPNPY